MLPHLEPASMLSIGTVLLLALLCVIGCLSWITLAYDQGCKDEGNIGRAVLLFVLGLAGFASLITIAVQFGIASNRVALLEDERARIERDMIRMGLDKLEAIPVPIPKPPTDAKPPEQPKPEGGAR